jgi:hypothetical protein
MSLLSRLPLIALLAGLVVFTATLFVTITQGTGISQPINLILIVLLALSVGMMFLAQNPNNERAALFCWFAAGVWGAAAYLNFQLLGLFQLIVAVLAAVSAFAIERESRVFSFIGPGLLIAVAFGLVVLSSVLGR